MEGISRSKGIETSKKINFCFNSNGLGLEGISRSKGIETTHPPEEQQNHQTHVWKVFPARRELKRYPFFLPPHRLFLCLEGISRSKGIETVHHLDDERRRACLEGISRSKGIETIICSTLEVSVLFRLEGISRSKGIEE